MPERGKCCFYAIFANFHCIIKVKMTYILYVDREVVFSGTLKNTMDQQQQYHMGTW